jgi:hypothetical protein
MRLCCVRCVSAECTRKTREAQVWSLVYTRRRACAVPRSVLRSGWDGADWVDGAGGAVVVRARAGAVAVQVAACALEVDEVALADVAADPADVDRRGFASFGNGANSGTCSDPGMDALQDVLAF